MNKFRVKLGFALGLAIIFVLGGMYWYVSYRSKTPDYTMHAVMEAMDKHDPAMFNSYVKVDSVLSASYDDLMAGILDTEYPLNEETKSALTDCIKMLKTPLITSFKASLNHYVATGEWNTGEGQDGTFDAEQILAKSGLKGTELRDVTGIEVNEADGVARAHLNVYQPATGSNYDLHILLRRNGEKIWQVEQIENFHDFVAGARKARRNQVDKYADETAAIWSKHDDNMRSADFEFQKILAAGSLGQESTRNDLKRLMLDTVKKDWQERRDELAAMTVPEEAASLQHLRLKICDLHINYAEGYAQWMEDKKAATIRDADAKLKQARTLEQEADFLARRLDNGSNE